MPPHPPPMTAADAAALTDANFPTIDPNTFDQIPPAVFAVIHQDRFAVLDPAQAAKITANQAAQMLAVQLEKIPPNALARMPAAAFQRIPPARFANLTAGQANALPGRLLAVLDRKSTRLNSSHLPLSRMPSSASKKSREIAMQQFGLRGGAFHSLPRLVPAL